MTAVVGIINKQGVAIAADSAVTRTLGNKGTKYTKNGSKMLRLSNAVPVSVMLTGNGAYIENPWDVIVRRYRQQRGDIEHPTVESCMHDFFAYIADTPIFWNDDVINEWITRSLDQMIDRVNDEIPWETRRTKDDGTYVRPQGFKNAFVKELQILRKTISSKGRCPQFADYTIDQFRAYATPILDEYFDNRFEESDPFGTWFTQDFLDSVRSEIELTLMEELSCRCEDMDDLAVLIFSGFGKEQEYPSLVSANVCEGFDHRVNYHVRKEDIVCISDEKPVAFCPFAQKDVTQSIIRGIYRTWGHNLLVNTKLFYNDIAGYVFPTTFEEQDPVFLEMLSEVKHADLSGTLRKSMLQQLNKNQSEWERALEGYDLKAMAELAESLIDLTGFQRILTFEQEGVGGPVDVAVITKNEGFTWIKRKSWHLHRDVNGEYGSMGI